MKINKTFLEKSQRIKNYKYYLLKNKHISHIDTRTEDKIFTDRTSLIEYLFSLTQPWRYKRMWYKFAEKDIVNHDTNIWTLILVVSLQLRDMKPVKLSLKVSLAQNKTFPNALSGALIRQSL